MNVCMHVFLSMDSIMIVYVGIIYVYMYNTNQQLVQPSCCRLLFCWSHLCLSSSSRSWWFSKSRRSDLN